MHEGMTFETENDTEVAAAYLTARDGRGRRVSGEALKARSTISTASTPSWSAPDRASASCAIRSPANPPSWPRPTAMSPSAPNIAPWPAARHRDGARLGAGSGDGLLLGRA